MRKPLIVISARDTKLSAHGLTFYGNIDDYYQYIKQAGGIPVTLFAYDEDDAEAAAQMADGLLLSGGDDVDPALYGAENTGSLPGNAKIDRSDILLYRAFVKAGKPVLGICRGLQVIAAAEKTELIQDIPSYGSYLNHSQWTFDPPVALNAKSHECIFARGSLLHSIFSDRYAVNSFHHQALKSVPAGYKETARSTDGLIEAIEAENVIAVQWHPERLRDDPKHAAIASAFIAMASAQDR